MKIEKLDTYYVTVDADINDWATFHDTGSYLRIKQNCWYYMDKQFNVTNSIFKYKAESLEKEFQETINVMHEQLVLL